VSLAAHPTKAPAVISQSPDAPRLMLTKGDPDRPTGVAEVLERVGPA